MRGTGVLLDAALHYWRGLPPAAREAFRFHHISTDEVYGSLGPDGFFIEDTPYAPNSPYSASKAASDHLVRAWHHTYGLPVVMSNCSNNYGPYHFPEKLIPLIILNGLEGKPLPVYGTGENVRDWLYVEDHATRCCWWPSRARRAAATMSAATTSARNIDVVKAVCALLDELAPNTAIGTHERLISFVHDRPGHDLRYAIDASRHQRELGWRPHETIDDRPAQDRAVVSRQPALVAAHPLRRLSR